MNHNVYECYVGLIYLHKQGINGLVIKQIFVKPRFFEIASVTEVSKQQWISQNVLNRFWFESPQFLHKLLDVSINNVLILSKVLFM